MALDALAADLLALLEGRADPAPARAKRSTAENSSPRPDPEPDGMKPAPVLVPIPAAAPERAPDPDRHCPACGSPSWWRSPAGWCCAYCSPRPAAFTGLALVLAGGQWASGCAPPAPETDTDRAPARHDDGRVRGPGGDWRTPAAHDAFRAFDAHHWRCNTCQRAGRGYGDRCPAGARLHALTRIET